MIFLVVDVLLSTTIQQLLLLRKSPLQEVSLSSVVRRTSCHAKMMMSRFHTLCYYGRIIQNTKTSDKQAHSQTNTSQKYQHVAMSENHTFKLTTTTTDKAWSIPTL